MSPRFVAAGIKLLGEKIREARNAQGWSLEHFSKLLGFPEVNVRRLEKGQIDTPNWELVNAIADLELLLKRDGVPFTTQELMLACCGYPLEMGDTPQSFQPFDGLNSSVSTMRFSVAQTENAKAIQRSRNMSCEAYRGVGGLIRSILEKESIDFDEFRSFTVFLEPDERDRLIQITEGSVIPDDLECANIAYALRRITGNRAYTQDYLIFLAQQNAPIQNGQEHQKA